MQGNKFLFGQTVQGIHNGIRNGGFTLPIGVQIQMGKPILTTISKMKMMGGFMPLGHMMQKMTLVRFTLMAN